MSHITPMHSAHYDLHGNIILDESMMTDAPAAEKPRVHEEERQSRKHSWNVTHADIPVRKATEKADHPARHSLKHSTFARWAEPVLHEGKKQIGESVQAAKDTFGKTMTEAKSLPARAHGLLTRLIRMGHEPVRLPRSKKNRRPRTKLELFVIDTVRFGGTFAGIFIVLFSAINYQSFLQIAKADLAIGSDLHTEQALQDIVGGSPSGAVSESIGGLPANSDGMLAVLPEVGPFEDRLIIPKIGKNVPIVRPGMDALMKEDWKQFESDIQSALHDGVVHYPGSAVPGQAGNFFLTGHSSYYPWDDGKYKDVFARLSELEPGDTYSVYYGGDKHTYRVTEKKEVKPSNVSVLDQPTDKRIATLMTCTPVGTTLRRLVVSAIEIDPATNEPLAVGQKATESVSPTLKRLEALPI